MSLYIPNVGEMDALKAILASREIILGLYRNQIIPDGNTIIDTITELPSGGGRGYAAKVLAMDLTEVAEATAKWYLSMNAAGKAEAQYGLASAPQEWVMTSVDVGDGYTVYGAFAYTWMIPFDAGQSEGPIQVGDTVTGLVSGATAIVTQVVLLSGTWAGDDAAGMLFVKTKSATAFQNDEALQVSATTLATSNTGTANAGDAHKRLMFVDAFSEGHEIDTVGLKFQYTPKVSMSTG